MCIHVIFGGVTRFLFGRAGSSKRSSVQFHSSGRFDRASVAVINLVHTRPHSGNHFHVDAFHGFASLAGGVEQAGIADAAALPFGHVVLIDARFVIVHGDSGLFVSGDAFVT